MVNFRVLESGSIAVYSLLATTWLLIALATYGWFGVWPVVLPFLLIALLAGAMAWWRLPIADRWVMAALLGLGLLLYTPPAEHLPLSGDAAIYPNEGAYIARTGGIRGVYAPLAALSPAAREPFYVSSSDQSANYPIYSYAGILYGGYYLVDMTAPTLQISRMPLSEVWLALLTKLVGMRGALYNTPLWSIAALIVLYLSAKQFVDRTWAVWATLLLAVSYPQIHFSQAPYAEIPGQFWTLAGFYFALCWINARKPWQLVTVLLCWTTTWAGRIDGLLLLSGVGVLGLLATTARDRRSLLGALVSLPLCVLLIWLATNGPYVGATYEIIARRWPWFGMALLGLLVALPIGVALFWHSGPRLSRWLQRIAPFLHMLIFVACFFVIAWSTLPNPWRVVGVTRRYQEIIWLSSYYLTPLFYWLALTGVGWLFWRGYNTKELLLLTTTLTLGALFFLDYTSARVYPVSLRRLISDLLPLLTMLAALGLKEVSQMLFENSPPVDLSGFQNLTGLMKGLSVAGRRYSAWLLGGVALGWMLFLSWPLLQQAEASGNLDFIAELHKVLPPKGVFLFENQDGDSWVGWLAAPLYSLYGDWALRLDSDEPEPMLLAQAVTEYKALGREVYLISQHNPLPAPLVPPGYTATLTWERVWQSSMIGQTRDPYPPPYWEFALPVYLFKIE